ncbi:PH-like domain-containing protein [Pseudokineococcus sp. 1T1Z-3]|uniref:PH-like domain-containing protein n=1 Tax=Pseudokineococcus sp. 1T1Z-3 TaxID=3132745 RepID=UPI0030A0E432
MSEQGAGVLVLLTIPVLWALMWWGWRRRSRRQADVPEPVAAPGEPGEPLLGPREGVYVGTTTQGDWLDRVVAHGLGRRSRCDVAVFAGGVSVALEAGDVLWLPVDRLRRVRRDTAQAGKVVRGEGFVVISWLLGPGDDRPVDSGLRLRREQDADALVTAVAGLLARQPEHHPAPEDQHGDDQHGEDRGDGTPRRPGTAPPDVTGETPDESTDEGPRSTS